jgi:hypothetical protein
MTPLIDGDILLHELGWSGQFKDKETGDEILLDFELVAEMLDEKIRLICLDVDATQPPVLYLTDSPWLNERVNKERKWQGLPPLPYSEGTSWLPASLIRVHDTTQNHFTSTTSLLTYVLITKW